MGVGVGWEGAVPARSRPWLLDFRQHPVRPCTWHVHLQRPPFPQNSSFLWAASSSPDLAQGWFYFTAGQLPSLLGDTQALSPSNTWGLVRRAHETQGAPDSDISSSFKLQKLPGKFKNLFRKFENLTVSGFGSFICPWTGTPENFCAHKPSTSNFPFKVFSAWVPPPLPALAHHAGREDGRIAALLSLEERGEQLSPKQDTQTRPYLIGDISRVRAEGGSGA